MYSHKGLISLIHIPSYDKLASTPEWQNLYFSKKDAYLQWFEESVVSCHSGI